MHQIPTSTVLSSTPGDQRVPAEVARVPFHGTYLHTILANGEPHVVLKPTIEGMGLDWEPQRKKLARRSWGVTSQREATGADGKTYEMATCGLQTWSMLLANIDENKVNETARPLVIAYQRESAQALRDYWTKGGAINPRATADQVDQLRTQLDDIERARLAQERLSAMGVAKQFGLVNSSYVEAMARTELARMNGEEPDIDPQDITITADEYLTQAGVSHTDLRSARVKLGRTVAVLYRARYGKDPQKIKRPIDGVHRDVAVYTMRDRDLFDTAWLELGRHYNLQTSINGGAR